MFYALQRMVAEAVLSLMVLEAKLRKRADIPSSDCSSETDQRFWIHGRDVFSAFSSSPTTEVIGSDKLVEIFVALRWTRNDGYVTHAHREFWIYYHNMPPRYS
jgi:hypothetical protein